MLLEEYDEEKVNQYLRQEAMEEGREQGEQVGGIKMLIQLVKNGSLDASVAAGYANMSLEEFEKMLK